MPDEWKKLMKLNAEKANANAHELSTGYDKIEVYLNSLVKSVTELQIK